MKIVHESGTRKKAKARASLTDGTGLVRINSKRLDEIKPEYIKLRIMEPLIIAKDVASKVDIFVRTNGGGQVGQANAARLAIAKGLIKFSRGKKLEKDFLDYDRTLLVADVRMKEPRKPNTHGKARSKRQKSYR